MTAIFDELKDLAATLGKRLQSRGLTLATAESCTGGLIGHALTEIPGSSDWYRGGIIAYANEVKEKQLAVPGSAIHDHGAVSEPVVRFMAQGARNALGTGAAISVSGVAGPSGGSPEKPVGTVWIGWNIDGHEDAQLFHFEGPRGEVKLQSARAAITGLIERLA